MTIEQAIELIESFLNDRRTTIYNRADDLEAIRILVNLAKLALETMPEDTINSFELDIDPD